VDCRFEEWLATGKARMLEYLLSKTEADSDLDSELRRISSSVPQAPVSPNQRRGREEQLLGVLVKYKEIYPVSKRMRCTKNRVKQN